MIGPTLINLIEPVTQGEVQQMADVNSRAKFSSAVLVSIILCLATFCVALDNTIVSTAVPQITDAFHSIDDVGWYAA